MDDAVYDDDSGVNPVLASVSATLCSFTLSDQPDSTRGETGRVVSSRTQTVTRE